MRREENKSLLDTELQRSEEVLYISEGPIRKRYLPKVNEFWLRIFSYLYFLGFGVLVGWILFKADGDTRRTSLTIILMIPALQIIGGFFSLGPFKKIELLLSNPELSVVTDRRVLIFDRNERIFNIPLNDFEAASTDLINGVKVIRLSKSNKFQDIPDVLIPDTQTPSLLSVLETLVHKRNSSFTHDGEMRVIGA